MTTGNSLGSGDLDLSGLGLLEESSELVHSLGEATGARLQALRLEIHVLDESLEIGDRQVLQGSLTLVVSWSVQWCEILLGAASSSRNGVTGRVVLAVLAAVRPHSEVDVRDLVAGDVSVVSLRQKKNVPLDSRYVVAVIAENPRQTGLLYLLQLLGFERGRAFVPEPIAVSGSSELLEEQTLEERPDLGVRQLILQNAADPDVDVARVAV